MTSSMPLQLVLGWLSISHVASGLPLHTRLTKRAVFDEIKPYVNYPNGLQYYHYADHDDSTRTLRPYAEEAMNKITQPPPVGAGLGDGPGAHKYQEVGPDHPGYPNSTKLGWSPQGSYTVGIGNLPGGQTVGIAPGGTREQTVADVQHELGGHTRTMLHETQDVKGANATNFFPQNVKPESLSTWQANVNPRISGIRAPSAPEYDPKSIMGYGSFMPVYQAHPNLPLLSQKNPPGYLMPDKNFTDTDARALREMNSAPRPSMFDSSPPAERARAIKAANPERQQQARADIQQDWQKNEQENKAATRAQAVRDYPEKFPNGISTPPRAASPEPAKAEGSRPKRKLSSSPEEDPLKKVDTEGGQARASSAEPNVHRNSSSRALPLARDHGEAAAKQGLSLRMVGKAIAGLKAGANSSRTAGSPAIPTQSGVSASDAKAVASLVGDPTTSPSAALSSKSLVSPSIAKPPGTSAASNAHTTSTSATGPSPVRTTSTSTSAASIVHNTSTSAISTTHNTSIQATSDPRTHNNAANKGEPTTVPTSKAMALSPTVTVAATPKIGARIIPPNTVTPVSTQKPVVKPIVPKAKT